MLVVDDHDLVRGLIVEILENAGLNVLQANNGLDALNQVQMHGATIGVILQDMSMPGMSGPETIVETLSLMPGANIIVLSVDEEHVVRQELGDIPVTGCLEKPCDADVLINSVKPYIV
ncbi:MAG: response regulator [Pseudomonadota bacterium]